MINLGNIGIGKMFLGDTKIAKAYLGDDLVYDNSGSTPTLPYDAQLEYLMGGDSPYIDTLVVPKTSPRIVIKLAMNSSFDYDVFGFENNTQPSFVGDICAQDGKQSFKYYRYYDTTWKGTALNSTVPIANYAEWDLGNVVKCNGTTLATYTQESFSSNTQSILLFRGRPSQTGSVPIKIAWAKIYDGDILKRDYIPVRVGTTGYMYDKVSGELFGNAGTGSFTLGDDITPVDYLQSSGTQYVSLPLSVAAGKFLQVDLSFTFTYSSSYNNYYIAGNYEQFVLQIYSNTLLSSTIGGNATSGAIGYTNGEKSNIFLSTTQRGYADGRVADKVRNITSTFNTVQLFGAVNKTGRAPIKIHSAKWKLGSSQNDASVVYDLIPVRVGQVGYMFDKISGNLFGNAGTGSFTLGSDIT